jgi:dihydropyrimidine dehydrogenase (NAD+) subunit PreT
MKHIGDLAPGRLSEAELAANFADVHPPLSPDEALIEANRCYFCFDAPCVQACPTGIDIPGFIRRIATGNLKGSAVKILEENIFGGSCARVCPTEILCEGACVRNSQEERPVKIGLLQRHATDWLMQRNMQPFERAQPTGKKIAVVGAGPAGLACAHRLARYGHEVVVFEAKPKPGGLNEYGVAAYKLTDAFARREIDFLLGIGGIRIEYGKALGTELSLGRLRRDYDAVFLGLGQAGVKALGLGEAKLAGVEDAVAFIARLRQTADKRTLAVGRRVVVIGGGNTAIDAAVQARKLGAEEVSLVYRRGPEQMSATKWEQDFAKLNGVQIRQWAAPVRLLDEDGVLSGVEFACTRLGPDGRLTLTEERFTLPADMVLSAIGQVFVMPATDEVPQVEGGRIVVDEHRQTSLTGVFAGGDCIAGPDLTVQAVQDGKLAAEAIHRMLSGKRED